MKTTKETLPEITELSYANADSAPVNYDWQEGYGEKWDYFSASRCDKCGQIVSGTGESCQHSELDDDSECDGYVSNPGPAMNYFYPLDVRSSFDPIEAAKVLADLPLVIVQFQDSDDYALALTGGGMDLSWEICEAFMRVGSLPPMHFCRLPGMAGRGQSARDKWIIAGCRRTAQGVAARAKDTIKELIRLKSRKQ